MTHILEALSHVRGVHLFEWNQTDLQHVLFPNVTRLQEATRRRKKTALGKFLIRLNSVRTMRDSDCRKDEKRQRRELLSFTDILSLGKHDTSP